jgi:hypothetical protein
LPKKTPHSLAGMGPNTHKLPQLQRPGSQPVGCLLHVHRARPVPKAAQN